MIGVRRADPPAGSLLRLTVLHRRTVLRGGVGLVMGAVVGGLHDTLDTYAVADPAPPPVAAPQPPPPPPPPPQFRRGDAGEAVRALQEQLGATGFWCGTPDGGFGHLTEQAVFAVQKTHGLLRDGVAGPATLGALATGVRPSPVVGGDHLEVHLASQLILIVRGGATQMTLNTSTGNGEPYTFEGHDYVAHTPTGDFAVWFTDGSGWREGELGRLYRPMFYDGNYAVHGSDSIPPWPASHGCARVSTAAMDMIWAEGLLQLRGRVLVV